MPKGSPAASAEHISAMGKPKLETYDWFYGLVREENIKVRFAAAS